MTDDPSWCEKHGVRVSGGKTYVIGLQCTAIPSRWRIGYSVIGPDGDIVGDPIGPVRVSHPEMTLSTYFTFASDGDAVIMMRVWMEGMPPPPYARVAPLVMMPMEAPSDAPT